MGRNSRLRKAMNEKKSPDVFFKRGRTTPKFVDAFWAWFTVQCRQMARLYPKMSAERPTSGSNMGVWILKGDPRGKRAFKELAVEAGRRIGSHAGPEEAMQFWLNHMHGDHFEALKPANIDWKTVDFLTQNSDGTREMHMGRYRQSGIDHRTDPSGKAPVAPMEIPKVVTPKAEPLIIIP